MYTKSNIGCSLAVPDDCSASFRRRRPFNMADRPDAAVSDWFRKFEASRLAPVTWPLSCVCGLVWVRSEGHGAREILRRRVHQRRRMTVIADPMALCFATNRALTKRLPSPWRRRRWSADGCASEVRISRKFYFGPDVTTLTISCSRSFFVLIVASWRPNKRNKNTRRFVYLVLTEHHCAVA